MPQRNDLIPDEDDLTAYEDEVMGAVNSAKMQLNSFNSFQKRLVFFKHLMVKQKF